MPLRCFVSGKASDLQFKLPSYEVNARLIVCFCSDSKAELLGYSNNWVCLLIYYLIADTFSVTSNDEGLLHTECCFGLAGTVLAWSPREATCDTPRVFAVLTAEAFAYIVFFVIGTQCCWDE